MDMPLIVSTPAEACAWLELRTGRPWQESELFDAAVKWGVTMLAAPPLSACASELEFVTPVDFAKYPTGFRRLHRLGWRMARLYTHQIFQVWTLGETETVHAATADTENASIQIWFDEPVRITRDQVRISDKSLLKLLTKHNRHRELFPSPGDGSQAAESSLPLPAGVRTKEIIEEKFGLHAPAGVPTKEIIEYFGLDSKWSEKLRRKDRSRLFDRARVQPGARCPGKSQTWNPAIFGALLITCWVSGYNAERVSVIINKHFPKWCDEWEAENQDLS